MIFQFLAAKIFLWGPSPHLGQAIIKYTNFRSVWQISAKSVQRRQRLGWRKWKKENQTAATCGCYIRAAPQQLAPLSLHSRSVPSPSQQNAQIAITCRFEHGVKWGYIKTFKPISATTLNIFVKLTYNVVQISYIYWLVVILRNFSCLPNYE